MFEKDYRADANSEPGKKERIGVDHVEYVRDDTEAVI